MQDNQASRLPA